MDFGKKSEHLDKTQTHTGEVLYDSANDSHTMYCSPGQLVWFM